MIRSFAVITAFVIGSALLQACAEATPGTAASPGQVVQSAEQTVTEALGKALPNETPDSVRAAPIPGFQEVTYGAQILYVSDDGRFALQGDLIDLPSQENITEMRRSDLRIGLLRNIDRDNLIVFSPEGETRHVLYVFTDVDCTYCRLMHSRIAEYNALGIEVRYLAFPRSGVGSAIYNKMVSVWCAEDRRAALTSAKAGDAVPAANCANPVREQYDIGTQVGVSGTPTLVFEDGSTIPGYVPPERLIAFMDEHPAIQP